MSKNGLKCEYADIIIIYVKLSDILIKKGIREMGDRNLAFNVSDGGQVNVAEDNSTIYATQNNGVSISELDKIIKEIMDNLFGLEEKDADSIRDIVDMAKDELAKPEPKVSRLRNCLSIIAPMVTIANGVPALTDNLQKLMDYIIPFIK